LHTFRGGAFRLDNRGREFLLVKVLLSISVQVIYKAWSLARYSWPHCCGSRYVHMWKIFSL